MAMAMRFSSSALDSMATELSRFDAPNIPELELSDDNTLQNNMLAGLIGAFSGEANARARHMITNIVRRVFASVEMYRLGRKYALDYVNGDRRNTIVPYFLALTNFECCVGYCWQVGDLLCKMSGQSIFSKSDGSAWQRLHQIHSVGTKHSFGKYAAPAGIDLPTTVWLSNTGIVCITGEKLYYCELVETIKENNRLFYEIQKRVLEKR